jgi:hypothetical protein
MEVLSTLMIGNHVMRVQVQGAKERLVAVLATAQAGYITATEDAARSRESLKSHHPLVADHSRNWTIGFESFSFVRSHTSIWSWLPNEQATAHSGSPGTQSTDGVLAGCSTNRRGMEVS